MSGVRYQVSKQAATRERPFVANPESGRRIWPLEPMRSEWEASEIAWKLARLHRFTGSSPVTVAQHSVLVSDRLDMMGHPPALVLWGLFHDAHEIATGDIPSPMKWALAELSAGQDHVTFIQALLDKSLRKYLRLPEFSPEEFSALAAADLETMAAEVRDLYAPEFRGYFGPLPEPWPKLRIEPWTYPRAAEVFLQRYGKLRSRMGLNG